MNHSVKTVGSREFARDVSAAKRAAAQGGAVIITDRGEPAFALLNIAEYRRLAGRGRNMADLLVMPEADEMDFEIETVRIAAQEFDA